MLRVLASTAAPKEAAGSRKARRGWAVPSRGKPLQLTSFDYASPLGANDVEIDVVANGLCHSDLHMAADDWHVSTFPFFPGHEVVGRITAARASGESDGPSRPLTLAVLAGGRERVQGTRWPARGRRMDLRQLPLLLRVRTRRGEHLRERISGIDRRTRLARRMCAPLRCVHPFLPDSLAPSAVANSLRVSSDFTYVIPDALSSEAAAPLLCAGCAAPASNFL